MSLSVRVELLSGRYVATAFNNRSQGEWPPHPTRLFSAATAAWADADERDPEERGVLEWLERQSPPEIACSYGADVAVRKVLTNFVPINDVFAVGSKPTASAYKTLVEAEQDVAVNTDDRAQTAVHRRLQQAEAKARKVSARANRKVLADATELLPDRRGRQPRTFPTITPADPRVTYMWPNAEPTPRQRSVLDGLLARVGRLGHSSSLVTCEVTEDKPSAMLIPDPAGELAIRVPVEGQLNLLDAEHARHRGTLPRVLASAMQAYTVSSTVPDPVIEHSVFSSRWISFTLDQPLPVSVRGSLPLARALRAALLEHCGEAPRLLTGRDAGNGSPTRAPHAAIVALPFVGHEHADGLIRGMAVVLPHEVDDHERRALAASVLAWEAATDGVLHLAGRSVRLIRSAGVESLVTQRPWSWSREAAEWVTVTPIALDRFPGDLDAGDPAARRQAAANAAATIARACVHIGLPEPVEVEPMRAGTLAGVPAARAFPRFTTPNGGPQRLLMHARLRFDEPVAGPMLLGAGRYVGQGLCWPLPVRSARA